MVDGVDASRFRPSLPPIMLGTLGRLMHLLGDPRLAVLGVMGVATLFI